jgi:ATP adenylyltransferase
MIDRIWSGWRAAYVTSERAAPADESVFRQLLTSGLDDDETHIVHRGPTCFAVMNAFPYTSGHLLVVPYREVADLDDLDGGELAELWSTVHDAVRVVRAAFSPDGVNVGMNLGRASGGSVPSHLHVHVVPRWTGDSNFMTAIANAQTLPESLGASAERVRSAWVSIGEVVS